MKYYNFKVMSQVGKDIDVPFAERRFLPFYEGETYPFYENFYEKGFILQAAHLDEGSSEVDFVFGEVEFGGLGFIISPKALQVISAFDLPRHEVLDIERLFADGKKADYKWIHFLIEKKGRYIDFVNSEIFSDEGARADSFEALIDIELNMGNQFDKIIFKEEFFTSKGTDLILIEGKIDYLISERLKEEIERHELTGLYPFEGFYEVSPHND